MPETRRRWLATVEAWLLPHWGFCPGGSHRPSWQDRVGGATCGQQQVGHQVLTCVLVIILKSQ